MELWADLLGLAGTAIVGLLGWALTQLGRWLANKTSNEWLTHSYMRLRTAIMVAVGEVQQTYVDAIKAASADGKLTEMEKSVAQQKAVDAAKSYLGPKGVKQLIAVLGVDDALLDRYIRGNVEAAIGQQKKTPASLPVISAPPLAKD